MWFIRNDLIYSEILYNCRIEHFITTKKLSNMADKNIRDKFLKSQNIDPNILVMAEQVHGSKVYQVKKDETGKRINGVDGLIADTENVAIGILTADCVPVFIFDKKTKKTGLLHCGRKGLKEGIIENGLAIFENLQDIVVALGPHICNKCYPVDLSKEIIRQLVSKGVKEDNIEPVDLDKFCTFHNQELFFSYRRGDKENRIISIVKM